MADPIKTPSPSSAMGKVVNQTATNVMKPLKKDSELYTINAATDTVRGQLDNNYANTDSPLMRRYAAQGKQEAQSRGLTNSTLAVQGGMANVLDKAGDFAKTDAGFYNDRKTEALRSRTAIDTTNISAEASRYGSDKQKEATLGAANIGASAEIKVAGMNNDASLKRLDMDLKSRESISLADRISNETIAKLDSDTKVALSQFEQRSMNTRLSSELTDGIYRDAAQGITNIDQTASPGTQNAQAQRIIDFQTVRLGAISDINAALGL